MPSATKVTPGRDLDHSPPVCRLPLLDTGMLKKSIAVLLLLTVTAWAEVVMAPMFSFHAGHDHASHSATPHAAHQHSMPAAHACCPGLKKVEPSPGFELRADGVPCEEQHRCCFRQGPQSTPSPVSDRRQPSPTISDNTADEAANLPVQRSTAYAATPALRPPPETFSTVLRI